MNAPRNPGALIMIAFFLSIFSGALGYMGAVAQFGARLAILERQGRQVDAIYTALLERGIIHAERAAMSPQGGSRGTSEGKAAAQVADRLGRRNLGHRPGDRAGLWAEIFDDREHRRAGRRRAALRDRRAPRDRGERQRTVRR